MSSLKVLHVGYRAVNKAFAIGQYRLDQVLLAHTLKRKTGKPLVY